MPDAVLYPAGGGVGLIGMWKAFEEMEHLGLVPRRVQVDVFQHRVRGRHDQPHALQARCLPVAGGDQPGNQLLEIGRAHV